MRATKRISRGKDEAQIRGTDCRPVADNRWEGPDFGESFWSDSDPLLTEAVFDVVSDESVVEPRPGEAPEAWRERVEEAVRARAAELRAIGDADAPPPGPPR